jgi:hypothetical protein
VEISGLYSSTNIMRVIKSRRMKWVGHAARMGKRKVAYSVLVGKPKGERPLGRTRRRWQENSKLDLKEVRWGGLNWIDLAQDRDRWRALVHAVRNVRVARNEGNFLTN